MIPQAAALIGPNAPPASAWCSFRLDAAGRLLEAGPSLETLTGFSALHWKQQPELLLQRVLPQSQAAYRDHARQGALSLAGSLFAFQMSHPTRGALLSLQEFRKPVFSAAGKLQAVEGLWIDVSRANTLEKQFAIASWKETLGALVPGLIHEFNNTLTGVLSMTDLFLGQIDATHAFHDGLTLIKQNVHQASQRLQRFHGLYRSMPGDPCYQDLNEVARETVELLRRAVRRADLSLSLAQDSLPVYADPVQLQNTVIQLVLNAMEAMPEGGQVRLETRGWKSLPAPLQAGAVRLPAVTLSVEDSGSGLSEAELRAVLDSVDPASRAELRPGVLQARLCAEAHKGALTVESRPGFGAIFTLWLPRADFSEAEDQFP